MYDILSIVIIEIKKIKIIVNIFKIKEYVLVRIQKNKCYH